MGIKDLNPTSYCIFSGVGVFAVALSYLFFSAQIQLASIINSLGLGFFAGSISFSSLSVYHSIGNDKKVFPLLLLKLLAFSLFPSAVIGFLLSLMMPIPKAIHLSIVICGLLCILVGYYLEKK